MDAFVHNNGPGLLCPPARTAVTSSAMRSVHMAGAWKSAASAQLLAQLASVLIECTSLSQADSSLVAMEKSSSESMIRCCMQQNTRKHGQVHAARGQAVMCTRGWPAVSAAPSVRTLCVASSSRCAGMAQHASLAAATHLALLLKHTLQALHCCLAQLGFLGLELLL